MVSRSRELSRNSVVGTRRICGRNEISSLRPCYIMTVFELTWCCTGEHCAGRVLRKKARRNGFSGCIRSTSTSRAYVWYSRAHRSSSWVASQASQIPCSALWLLDAWWSLPGSRVTSEVKVATGCCKDGTRIGRGLYGALRAEAWSYIAQVEDRCGLRK